MPDVLDQLAEQIELNADLALVLFQHNPDAIIVVDDSAVIRLANRQALFLSGYPLAELAGEKIELLLPEAARARHEEHRKGYVEDLRIRPMGADLNLRLRHKNGSEIAVLINLAPAMTKQGTFVIATIRRRAT